MLASRFAPQLIFLAVLVVSRLVFHALGLAPDPAIVVDHWQHVDLRFLAADPIGSLWDLHSQPPLWNAILAIAVKLAGPDGDAVTAVMYGFNLILTAGCGLLMMSILRRLGFSQAMATALAILGMLSPNTLYFETYIFYPQFTAFLVTLLVWLLVQVKRDGPLWPVAGALGVITALSWTWAIFHPVFVAIAAAALVVWHRGWTLQKAARPVIALAVLATGVSTLPTVKNTLTWGIPSASTWIGMNLAQTIPGGQTGEFVPCDFEVAYHQAFAATAAPVPGHPMYTQTWKRPGAPNMNNIGLIEPSKRCAGMMKTYILHDPIGWLASRIQVIAGTHQLPPSNYNADPLGWDAIFGPAERATESLGSLSRSTMTLWYLVLVYVGVRSIRQNPPLYLSLMGVVVYFTLVSHLLNGGEQARMRYTIEPIYFLWSALMLRGLGQRFGVSLSMPGWLRLKGASQPS
jgi:hypothetical protein